MNFDIIDNMQVPTNTRNRTKSPLDAAIAALEVGQGFEFESTKPLKTLYPKVSPKKFGGAKRFKLWQTAEGQYSVARIELAAE